MRCARADLLHSNTEIAVLHHVTCSDRRRTQTRTPTAEIHLFLLGMVGGRYGLCGIGNCFTYMRIYFEISFIYKAHRAGSVTNTVTTRSNLDLRHDHLRIRS